MKIGILACLYGNSEYLSPCLENWLKLKKDKNLVLAAVHGQFSEYNQMGVPDEDFDTQKQLKKLYKQKKLDFLYLQNDYDDKETARIYENEAQIRNKSLQWLLTQNVDKVILLDLDEFWTEDEIDNLIKYISEESNQSSAWMNVSYKNYILDGKQYLDNFAPPRVFAVNYQGYTIDKFFWDNDIQYKENLSGRLINYKDLPHKQIEKNICHVHHNSWLDTPKNREKVKYHLKHFGACSYRINPNTDSLEINFDYYLNNSLPIPLILKD